MVLSFSCNKKSACLPSQCHDLLARSFGQRTKKDTHFCFFYTLKLEGYFTSYCLGILISFIRSFLIKLSPKRAAAEFRGYAKDVIAIAMVKGYGAELRDVGYSLRAI